VKSPQREKPLNRFETIKNKDIPSDAAPMLDKIKTKNGFVPNLIEGIAVSPQLLEGYVSLSKAFENTSLTPEEQQIVLLTTSRLNECGYCTSVHSLTAEQTDLSWDTVEKIRNREALSNDRFEALRTFVERIVASKGSVPQDVWTQFQSVGFDAKDAMAVILGVTLKTLTNSANHFMETPLDEAFQKRAWSPSEAQHANA
jgi:uncharacterized peroxidase-related enzyme